MAFSGAAVAAAARRWRRDQRHGARTGQARSAAGGLQSGRGRGRRLAVEGPRNSQRRQMELPTGRNLCSIPRTSHRIVRITTYTLCRIPSEHQKCWHFVCRPWRRLSCLIALPFTGYLEEREGRERADSAPMSSLFMSFPPPFRLHLTRHIVQRGPEECFRGPRTNSTKHSYFVSLRKI